jgi:hypothetical protein
MSRKTKIKTVTTCRRHYKEKMNKERQTTVLDSEVVLGCYED